MARAEISVFDLIEDKKPVKNNSEVASFVEQQQALEAAGELQPVRFIGPNGSFIPGYYSTVEQAFLPQFEDKSS